MYVHSEASDSVHWLDETLARTDCRSTSLHMDDQDIGICLHRFWVPRGGAQIFWTFRDVQSGLSLSHSSSYASKFICNNWEQWCAKASDAGIPDVQMIRSHTSRQALEKMGILEA